MLSIIIITNKAMILRNKDKSQTVFVGDHSTTMIKKRNEKVVLTKNCSTKCVLTKNAEHHDGSPATIKQNKIVLKTNKPIVLKPNPNRGKNNKTETTMDTEQHKFHPDDIRSKMQFSKRDVRYKKIQ